MKDKMKKVMEKLPEGMQEELENLDPKELKERIAKSATIISETKSDMEENAEIRQAKEVLDNLKEPYKETLVAQDAIIKYSIKLLKDKGKL